jgi:hypothetical protein
MKKLQKVIALYNDSYNRSDNEWMACNKQGINIIKKQLGNIDKVTTISANIFKLLACKEVWFPAPNKDVRGADFQTKFENALKQLGVAYKVVDNGLSGRRFILA